MDDQHAPSARPTDHGRATSALQTALALPKALALPEMQVVEEEELAMSEVEVLVAVVHKVHLTVGWELAPPPLKQEAQPLCWAAHAAEGSGQARAINPVSW